MVRLSRLSHVAVVAAQTNLSRDVGWAAAADPSSLQLWCTYHPGQVALGPFLARCRRLGELGVAHSVGVVGFPDHLEPARALRARLPAPTYLWVNPADGLGRPYTADEVAAWTALDPLFPLALEQGTSLGTGCRTGETVVSVDGDGTVRRCHFVAEPIGNLYDGSWRAGLRPRPCPNRTCDCFIGYVHRDAARYDGVFGRGLLGRIPLGTGA